MAATKRNNGPARWALLVGTGLAAAGFWTAIVTGPQPAQASPAPVSISQSQTASSSATPATRVYGSGGQLGPITISPSQSQSPQFSVAPTPRFRTRAS